jgi:hypothetical protein
MARRRSLALIATVCVAVLVTACEQEDRAAREPAAAKSPSAKLASAPAGLANAPAGVCGADDEQKPAGSACGAGCGCNGAGCADPTAKTEGCGCGMHNQGKTDAPVVPITEAKVGDRTRCPVTNQVFVVGADSPKTEFDGKTYYFCCEGCVNKFKQNPQQFTNS